MALVAVSCWRRWQGPPGACRGPLLAVSGRWCRSGAGCQAGASAVSGGSLACVEQAGAGVGEAPGSAAADGDILEDLVGGKVVRVLATIPGGSRRRGPPISRAISGPVGSRSLRRWRWWLSGIGVPARRTSTVTAGSSWLRHHEAAGVGPPFVEQRDECLELGHCLGRRAVIRRDAGRCAAFAGWRAGRSPARHS